MMCRGVNGSRRFEWWSCLHLQSQAIQEDRLTLKTKDYVPSKRLDLLAQRRSVTTRTTSIFKTRKYVDHCLSSRIFKRGRKKKKVGTRNSNPFIRNRLELYFGWRKQKPLQTFDVDTAHMYTAAASFSRMLNIISLPYNKMFSTKKTDTFIWHYGQTDAAFPYTI